VVAVMPRSTGTPWASKMSRAWYSYRSTLCLHARQTDEPKPSGQRRVASREAELIMIRMPAHKASLLGLVRRQVDGLIAAIGHGQGLILGTTRGVRHWAELVDDLGTARLALPTNQVEDAGGSCRCRVRRHCGASPGGHRSAELGLR
jgi:hypothetical protein